jgi:hypothetical protein
LTRMQPEEPEWGIYYLALLSGERSLDPAELRDLLASGVPLRHLHSLYPLSAHDFARWVTSCSHEGTSGADQILSLQYSHGQWTQGKLISSTYRAVTPGNRSDEYVAFRKSYRTFGDMPAGRMSSLADMWELYQILHHWPDLTPEVRTQLGSAYLIVAKVLGVKGLVLS